MHRTPEEWKSVVLDQIQSGLTITEYCKQHKIAKSAFYRWRSEYKNDLNLRVPKRSEVFKPLEVQSCPQTNQSQIQSQFNLQISNWLQLTISRSC